LLELIERGDGREAVELLREHIEEMELRFVGDVNDVDDPSDSEEWSS
jgi:DNA-binding GntR family transcriptional regulator